MYISIFLSIIYLSTERNLPLGKKEHVLVLWFGKQCLSTSVVTLKLNFCASLQPVQAFEPARASSQRNKTVRSSYIFKTTAQQEAVVVEDY